MVHATEAVLGCTELLELILSFTNADDLLALQRTCRRWNAVIIGSSTLQRCFYFSADRRGVDAYGLNPLLLQRFKFSRDTRGYLCIESNNEWRGHLLSQPTASWRRMLVSQPPEPFFLSVVKPSISGGFSGETFCGDAWDTLEELKERSRCLPPNRQRELWV